ncbi:hypothetical protein ACMFMG_010539 [Clarireedia jacksonii]
MSYAPIALQATDLLVGKHFDKLPNSLFDKDRYKPNRLRRKSRKRRDQPDERTRDRDDRDDRDDNPEIVEPDELGYQSEPESKSNMHDIPRHSGQGAGGSQYSNRSDTPPFYSQQPPRTSQQQSDYYFPPPPIEPYPDPRPSSYGRDDRPRRGTFDDRDRNDYESNFYHDQRRRPKPIARRSSYDDLPIRDSHRKDQQLERRKPKSLASERGSDEGIREKAHRYGVKDEIKDMFSDSRKGLAGGAIGALVGGWAADKLQEAQTGKTDSERSGRSRLITLLGAAAGGLAANAVVDKWEDDKKKTTLKQQDWDDKWNRNGSRSRDRGDKSREREDKGRGRDERRRRDSVMSFDSRDRYLAYDERTSRSDGRGYNRSNDGYY